MNAFVPYLAALHQRDLLEEACLDRLARRARVASQGVSAPRRALGHAANGLSGLLASAARSLDPSLESRTSPDRVAFAG
jgi:hypothetical protein